MKVLWFSNYTFSDKADVQTGTWLGAMGRALAASGRCELTNISTGGAQAVEFREIETIRQYLLPRWKIGRDGLPCQKNLDEIKRIVDVVAPDIIHVWGLESYYGLLVSRGIINAKHLLLDIQGIRFAVGNFFMGTLSLREQLKCFGSKEILRPQGRIGFRQKRFLEAKNDEREIIAAFQNISYQSEWSHDYLKMLSCSGTRLYKTVRALRTEFVENVTTWRLEGRESNPRIIFAICGGNEPYKGLFVLLRAYAEARRVLNARMNTRLIVGGGFGRAGMFRDGYKKFIEAEIERLRLSGFVEFVGALNARQLHNHLLRASVFVHPSFIESYSLAVAEAMRVAVPCVVSHAGAMPELAVDGESALYFQPGDYMICAERICRILLDDNLAESLSRGAATRSQGRNEQSQCVARQLEIYDAVLSHRA